MRHALTPQFQLGETDVSAIRFDVGRLKTAIFSLFSCPGFEPVFPCKKARFLMLLDSKAQ
jgi:hypothetical protein